ncbi:uncharacterized protein A1O9_06929 [Exophiala aquamarina CBS 119918]|uniref:Cyclohexanone monooxygenase n=1 Tax=Exophiala aquamarina CBS 119918 TaxID=1182545 RepID=A0A072P9F7_9EURO|nr:uncharacterized protein A1O9_06929 [Exophiala aquamarina CBS 119918]KEF56739.1 hypothetical protein A1O9_06929 [Exophiala aquamarina CBS 119918]
MGSIQESAGREPTPPYDFDPPSKERPAIYGWENTSSSGYKIDEVPSGLKRPLRVVVVGAGAAGINFAKFAQDRLENVNLTVYDRNKEVGGTWTENVYPGCACDIPSVTYQYTWEPKVWSKYYSEAPEILQYFVDITHKYGLRKYIKLQHTIDKAEWDDQLGKWNLHITSLEESRSFHDQCDVLINAGGILNYWKWPNVKGIEKYKGIKAHTAAYPKDLDLKGKRVAVVGTGSSGIQLITKLQPQVEKLYTWIRTPTWMTAGYAQAHAGPDGGNFEYPEEMRKRFAEDPEWYLKYRKTIEYEMSDFMFVHKNTPALNAANKFALADMQRRLASRPDLMHTLIPKVFPLGCRRPTPGNGYLEALISKNVSVFLAEALDEITEEGFKDPSGNEIQVDALLFATGFDTTWVPRFPIISYGSNLQDVYAEDPLGYFGVAAPEVPNYLTFYGPYGPAGQGSVLPMIEFMSRYHMQWIEKLQTERIKSFAPKRAVVDEYGAHADVWHKRTMIYSGVTHVGCSMELISSLRPEDFNITYQCKNRWNFLGNGFTQRDVNGKDITWYMGLVDGIDKQRDYVV